MAMINQVVNVKKTIGLIGLIRGSRKQLDKQVKKVNDDGWEVHQYIKGGSANLFVWVLQTLLLCITLFLYSRRVVATLLCKKEAPVVYPMQMGYIQQPMNAQPVQIAQTPMGYIQK